MNYIGQNKKVHGIPFGLSTAHKMKFSIKDLFCKCDQIRRKLRIWSHLLKKSLIENFTFLCSAKRAKPLRRARFLMMSKLTYLLMDGETFN